MEPKSGVQPGRIQERRRSMFLSFGDSRARTFKVPDVAAGENHHQNKSPEVEDPDHRYMESLPTITELNMSTLTQTTTTTSNQSSKLLVPGLQCGPYGQRLCVQVADELAKMTPERIYATVTKSPSNIESGFRDVTIRQFADAVNCAAWSIRSQFGESDNFDVIAYIGVSDIRYAIYLYAAIKTGYQV